MKLNDDILKNLHGKLDDDNECPADLQEDPMDDGRYVFLITKQSKPDETIAFLPETYEKLKIENYRTRFLKYDKSSNKQKDSFWNFRELIFFTNSVYGCPIFTNMQTLNKFYSIIYGVTPAEMAQVIVNG
jgi:hypothetical protein